jgi:hypothetical protein
MTYPQQVTTSFEKVCDFYNQIDFLPLKSDSPEYVPYLHSRIELIKKCLIHFEKGVGVKNRVKTIHALSDILYTVLSIGHSIDLNLDEAIDKMYKSNISKFCINEEDAKDTVEWYKEQPHETQTTPAYRLNPAGYFIIYDEKNYRILKSIDYVSPDLTSL